MPKTNPHRRYVEDHRDEREGLCTYGIRRGEEMLARLRAKAAQREDKIPF